MTLQRGEALRLLMLGCGLLAIYALIGQLPLQRSIVSMPTWVPFWPIMTVPYLLQLGVSWLLLLLVRDPVRRRAVVRATVISFVICAVGWIAIPTILPRPDPTGTTGWLLAPYRLLICLDAPTNVMPCGHLLAPVLITAALLHEHPRWAWWLIPFQILGAIAIVTTWQHRPVDLALAGGVALTAGWSCGLMRR